MRIFALLVALLVVGLLYEDIASSYRMATYFAQKLDVSTASIIAAQMILTVVMFGFLSLSFVIPHTYEENDEPE